MARKPTKNLSPDDQAKYDQLPPELKKAVDLNKDFNSKVAQIRDLYDTLTAASAATTTVGGGTAAPTFTPTTEDEPPTARFESAIGLEAGRRVDLATNAPIAGTATRIAVDPMQELRGQTPSGFVPRYYERDADLLSRFTRDQIADIQAKLNKSGLLGSKYRLGVVDQATRNAWIDLLGEANRSNVDWNTALKTAAATPIGGKTALPPKVSNPEDIKQIVNQVSAKILGRSADPMIVDRIVKQFQASQVQTQTGLPVTGGRRVEPMDLTTLAQTKITKAAGPEADAYKAAQFIEKILGGG